MVNPIKAIAAMATIRIAGRAAWSFRPAHVTCSRQRRVTLQKRGHLRTTSLVPARIDGPTRLALQAARCGPHQLFSKTDH